jgi:hypothetical protein
VSDGEKVERRIDALLKKTAWAGRDASLYNRVLHGVGWKGEAKGEHVE